MVGSDLLYSNCNMFWYLKAVAFIFKFTSSMVVLRNYGKTKVKIKTKYYLELLTPKTMELLWITERRISKDKNKEKLQQL